MDHTWKALSDPLRRSILDLLRERPYTTSEICEAFDGLTRFRVMNHMSVLKDAGLIQVEKRGRERINSLDPDPLRAAYYDWLRDYDVFWAGRLGRLKRLAEAEQRKRAMDTPSLPTVDLVTMLIEHGVEIDAAPAAVFSALTDEIGEWWGAPYLQAPDDATDIILEPYPGGLLKELTRGGDGAVWGTVQEIRRNRLLVLEGRMSMRAAVHGTVRFELEGVDTGVTRLSLTHRAIGAFTAEHRELYGGGWRDQLDNRLKLYVETGQARGIRAR